jgi:hypothetical protein
MDWRITLSLNSFYSANYIWQGSSMSSAPSLYCCQPQLPFQCYSIVNGKLLLILIFFSYSKLGYVAKSESGLASCDSVLLLMIYIAFDDFCFNSHLSSTVKPSLVPSLPSSHLPSTPSNIYGLIPIVVWSFESPLLLSQQAFRATRTPDSRNNFTLLSASKRYF